MADMTLERYQQQERELARREAHRGLRIHGAVTVAVTILVAVINVFVASEFPWAIFPAVGMSVGVWFHWYFGVRHEDEVVRQHQQRVEREVGRHAA